MIHADPTFSKKAQLASSSQNEKVVMALSGGMHSGVAASLLKNQGVALLGVHLVFPAPKSGSLGALTQKVLPRCVGDSQKSLERAQVQAKKLGIPLEVVHLDSVFEERWTDRILHELLESRFPNPCMICKSNVLLPELLTTAARLTGRADARVATGHCVRVSDDLQSGERVLQVGVDPLRDHSFWLSRVSSVDLKRMVFPVGELSSKLLIRLAQESGLSAADHDTAQGVEAQCVGRTKESLDWVDQMIPASLKRPGAVRTPGGTHINSHDGMFRHHLGQKLISAEVSLDKQDVFVIQMDRVKNLVLVGNTSPMMSSRWILKKALWRRPRMNPLGEVLAFRVQSRGDLLDAKLIGFEGGAVRMEIQGNKALSAGVGQMVVFYQGDEVVLSAEIDQIAPAV